MYHIDRHLTKELRKKKGIKCDNPVEFLSAYTGIGFELYWTDEELLKIAKKDPDYKYTYFLKHTN